MLRGKRARSVLRSSRLDEGVRGGRGRGGIETLEQSERFL